VAFSFLAHTALLNLADRSFIAQKKKRKTLPQAPAPPALSPLLSHPFTFAESSMTRKLRTMM
jgi:hypothetical protein